MALVRITSPHARGNNRTQTIMLWVLGATLPGVAVMTWLFGFGTLINILLASCFALALPPYVPWWLVLVGTSFAIVFGKQLYGGLGQNPFNPAMVGYVVVLISFPVEMTTWPAWRGIEQALPDLHSVLGLLEALQRVFLPGSVPTIDGWTLATPLDVVKNNSSLTMDELAASGQPVFGSLGGRAWEWVNIAYLLGGAVLIYKRVLSWHAPAGMLLALGLMSLLFWGGSGSDSNGSPMFHLLSGATMLGAFFIVTDPVSGATSSLGRIVFGAGVGILVYVIRAWGGYPDAVAFAVLLMNLAAPTIDYYTTPRTYGHRKAERGMGKAD